MSSTLAAGLPIVAGATGGIPEMVDEGVEGRFWPLDDAVAGARILVDLLDDEPTRSTTGAAALSRFHAGFDAAVVGPRLERLLVDGVDAPNAPNTPNAPTGTADPVANGSDAGP